MVDVYFIGEKKVLLNRKGTEFKPTKCQYGETGHWRLK